MIEIQSFEPKYESEVIDLIVSIQNGEFGLPITAEDQPDLRIIPAFYQTRNGDFLVALSEQKVVGTISLKDIGNGQGALRKMFVAAPFRGKEHGLGGRLLRRLVTDAAQHGISEVFLGTTRRMLGAHRFYEKNGFREVTVEDLPKTFPQTGFDDKFYALRRDEFLALVATASQEAATTV